MPIEPIKIPQNVYIEDRIVGPLTLKQVIICAIGGGFSYAMFASISKAYGSVALPIQILVWMPAAVAAIFAFVRINDLSMMRLCLLLLERLNKPTTRTWAPRRGIIINVRTFHTVAEDKGVKHAAVTEKKTQHIDELSNALDKPLENIFTGEEPVEPEEFMTEDNPNVIRHAVDPTRISVSPAAQGPSVDSVVPASGAVSIFRDISPA